MSILNRSPRIQQLTFKGSEGVLIVSRQVRAGGPVIEPISTFGAGGFFPKRLGFANPPNPNDGVVSMSGKVKCLFDTKRAGLQDCLKFDQKALAHVCLKVDRVSARWTV